MDDRVAPSSPRVNDHRAGHLVTYLGTAPGVGKTFRMLRDARTRAEAGDDVVVGWVERHGRAATREQAQRLEIVRPRAVAHRGASFEDLDVSAVIERHPDVVLVDELAHTGVDGRARYRDVQELLGAGIDVMTTVNVANLVSVRDVAARITGAGALEGVPDDVVRAGDVVLVDLPPDALRRRVADGLVLSADGVGGALANYFRPSNLQLLDTLARSWLDGGVDETFAFLDREAPARQKVIAGVSSSIRGQAVIERAAVLAGEDDAELEVVHVELQDGLGRQPERLEHYREMAQSVGARYREVYGVNAADTLGDLARSERARRVVVGARRSRLTNLVRGSVAARIRRRAPGIDVDEVAACRPTSDAPAGEPGRVGATRSSRCPKRSTATNSQASTYLP
ncbi:MAG TPA: universal stress protein [Acidimicrobiia bacterium]|nr:universal stress protein [Acidimicrobiia bacterium]